MLNALLLCFRAMLVTWCIICVLVLFVLWTEHAYSRGVISGEIQCYEESAVSAGT